MQFFDFIENLHPEQVFLDVRMNRSAQPFPSGTQSSPAVSQCNETGYTGSAKCSSLTNRARKNFAMAQKNSRVGSEQRRKPVQPSGGGAAKISM